MTQRTTKPATSRDINHLLAMIQRQQREIDDLYTKLNQVAQITVSLMQAATQAATEDDEPLIVVPGR